MYTYQKEENYISELLKRNQEEEKYIERLIKRVRAGQDISEEDTKKLEWIAYRPETKNPYNNTFASGNRWLLYQIFKK